MPENNLYKPAFATIVDMWPETEGERGIITFKVQLAEEYRDRWQYMPGQCAMIGVLGVGEAMISLSSSPTEGDQLRFSVMRMGKVTRALHERQAGDTITIRGPYGNGFPVEDWKGKNIVTIGGGIGQAPLRSLIEYVRANRDKYGALTIIYGARTSADLCFQDELAAISAGGAARCYLSIDIHEPEWRHFVGFVPALLMRCSPQPQNSIAVTCGPPAMSSQVIVNLKKLGFSDQQIFTTLENRMKCGVGKCGRCNIGELYVCRDGPVFNYSLLKDRLEALI